MKELLLQYAQYNVWANKLIIDTMLAVEEGGVDKEMVSSFPTLRKTMIHMWSAESIWLQRVQGVAQPIWHARDYAGTFTEGCQLWQTASADWVQYAENSTDTSLRETATYLDHLGNDTTMVIYHVMHHVFNHSTYHRGQLVTMLRQAGATVIPATDFEEFVMMEKG